MYFNNKGKENTSTTIDLALKTAVQKGIKHIVVASSKGGTAKLLKNGNGINIVAVTHANGYPEAGKSEITEEIRKELEELGIKVLTTTHVLSGAERGISRAFGGINPVEIIAQTLRMFGQGTKVCVEVSVMALDAGLIPFGEPIIAIGGSAYGADTALILTPSHASSIFDVKIHEVICKPSYYNE
ncbi:pyruvate kinase alpha/beta domain-containing protein [Clostridium sp. JS66]|uniref:pyruvate kinase alpha/beta domain-containing protein n=1 Tax=Clostridium sp. JS66 TaxID=3064705 RepID=UPI00298E7E35|nr:pyruvate kinase alpha/beta domain-containing protein [Clostridium sp. JS66]WPC39395.1 pyruvate kinase alpha/beta domain-containing protein [Clostridium sp. JS66]